MRNKSGIRILLQVADFLNFAQTFDILIISYLFEFINVLHDKDSSSS